MNALLGYGSSSSGSDSEDDNEKETIQEKSEPKTCGKLPTPALSLSTLHTSVFSNPFVEAEMAKAAILEKHVKMVPGKNNTQLINGKKICWNYRKGRCRFGHNCVYAHDTDLQKTPKELNEEKQKSIQKSVVCEQTGTQSSGPPPEVSLESVSSSDDVYWEGNAERRGQKRPGLSQGLVPGKKVLQMYKKQRQREHPNK